jgi:hypothetical protein
MFLPLPCFALPARSTSLSILLAMMFFVSHNVPENKALPGGVQDTKKVGGVWWGEGGGHTMCWGTRHCQAQE